MTETSTDDPINLCIHCLGKGNVQSKNTKINTPSNIFDLDILELGERLHWSFDPVARAPVVCRYERELKDTYEKYVGSTKSEMNETIRIPQKLTPQSDQLDKAPDDVCLTTEEDIYFVATDGMLEPAESNASSFCYIMNSEQYRRFKENPVERTIRSQISININRRKERETYEWIHWLDSLQVPRLVFGGGTASTEEESSVTDQNQDTKLDETDVVDTTATADTMHVVMVADNPSFNPFVTYLVTDENYRKSLFHSSELTQDAEEIQESSNKEESPPL